MITSCPSVMIYEQSAAERVKAKMKLQLAETGKHFLWSLLGFTWSCVKYSPYCVTAAEKDTTKGMDGWERFEFNKDAPLDDEEVEGETI